MLNDRIGLLQDEVTRLKNELISKCDIINKINAENEQLRKTIAKFEEEARQHEEAARQMMRGLLAR